MNPRLCSNDGYHYCNTLNGVFNHYTNNDINRFFKIEVLGNFVDGNALLVDESKNHSDWSKYIEKLVKNPNLVKDMGERLYETVKDKYDLNIVTKDREIKSQISYILQKNTNIFNGRN